MLRLAVLPLEPWPLWNRKAMALGLLWCVGIRQQSSPMNCYQFLAANGREKSRQLLEEKHPSIIWSEYAVNWFDRGTLVMRNNHVWQSWLHKMRKIMHLHDRRSSFIPTRASAMTLHHEQSLWDQVPPRTLPRYHSALVWRYPSIGVRYGHFSGTLCNINFGSLPVMRCVPLVKTQILGHSHYVGCQRKAQPKK